MPTLPVPALTIGLLLASNVVMTFAWHGHLRFKGVSLAESVFAAFSVTCLKEPSAWNYVVGFAFIALGAFFIIHEWS